MEWSGGGGWSGEWSGGGVEVNRWGSLYTAKTPRPQNAIITHLQSCSAIFKLK